MIKQMINRKKRMFLIGVSIGLLSVIICFFLLKNGLVMMTLNFIILLFIILVYIFDRRKHRKIIKRLQAKDEYIELLIKYDELTGLPNKTLFYEKVQDEIAQGHKGAILLLDIDNFNSINDTLGHAYGDDLIKGIALRLSAIDQEKLFISRYGGDEFTVLLLGKDDIDVIKYYVEQIQNALKEALIINDRENFISFSCGVTCFPKDSLNPDKLMVYADTAMYRVKHQGKNDYMFFQKQMQEEIKKRIELEAILRNAINTNGFHLVYQPQVNTLSGDIISFEGLLRLKEHDITPDVFIPVAEETGLIIEIGRWVAKEVIEQLARWKEKGFTLKPIAFNYSNRQLQDDSFSQFLMDLMLQYEIEPKYLEIEITESILLDKTDRTFRFLSSTNELGIRLALDDFGRGFSSIDYLTFIPVHKIKLDKSLCDKFLEPDNDKVILHLVSLVHSLGLVITAEGIERIEQFNRLRKVGCDYIQGYLFSKPAQVDVIEKIYHQNLLSMVDSTV